MRQVAEKLAQEIRDLPARARNGEELRVGIASPLDRALKQLGIHIRLELEENVPLRGHADAVLGQVWLEFERPGALSSSAGLNQSRRQLIRHLTGEAWRYPQDREQALRKMVGVALDGERILFLRYRTRPRGEDPLASCDQQPPLIQDVHLQGEFELLGPLEINQQSISSFLLYLRALSRRPLTPENLARQFGPKGELAGQLVPTLYQKLVGEPNVKVETIFGEWERLFGIIYGRETVRAEADAQELARLYNVQGKVELKPLLFSVHTYCAWLMKLLAAELIWLQSGALVSPFVAELPSLIDNELKERLTQLEEGEVFSQLGIRNFLEGDLFGWYLAVWDKELAGAARGLARALGEFEPATITLEPEATRDLLKKLYQCLIPKRLRHDLGEYHTPDWLAELVLNRVKYEGDPDYRLIDPACGSGTFLVQAIKRIRKYAHEERIPGRILADKILNNVVGFDLNPLAVIAARTNYWLALGDLVRHKRPIEIPVYRCDSILTPGQHAELFGTGYRLRTVVGDFVIPEEIIDNAAMEKLTALLEECARTECSEEVFLRRAVPALGVEKKATESMLSELYARVISLARQGNNGLWPRLLKNAFAPIFVGKFDFVVGNPPWVNWQDLDKEYRKATQGLWQKYGLFPHKGPKTKLGSAKDDLSILMAYACMDQYLPLKGWLGFLITQTVFKTRGGGEGFRRLRIGDGEQIKIEAVDDMTRLQPFEGAANRTGLFVCQKGATTKYPISYVLWEKKRGADFAADSSLEEVVRKTKRANLWFKPLDSHQTASPWIIARRKALAAMSNMMGPSFYRARAGACTWANGVYWFKVLAVRPDGLIMVENIQEASRLPLRGVQTSMEPDLIYPLLRGRDVSRWKASPAVHILVPYRPDEGRPTKEAWLRAQLPYTFAYLKSFQTLLSNRSGYQKLLQASGAPFYSLYDVGPYTFAPFKVVWREQAGLLTAAVVGQRDGKTVVPDHKLMLIPLESSAEAHYVCAALNSCIPQLVINTNQALENVSIPKFDTNSDTHAHLCRLSQRAHELTSLSDAETQEELAQLEEEINLAAADLWGITSEELVDVKRSLKELG